MKVGSVQSSHLKSLSTSFLGFYAMVLECKLYLKHIYKYRPPTQLLLLLFIVNQQDPPGV